MFLGQKVNNLTFTLLQWTKVTNDIVTIRYLLYVLWTHTTFVGGVFNLQTQCTSSAYILFHLSHCSPFMVIISQCSSAWCAEMMQVKATSNVHTYWKKNPQILKLQSFSVLCQGAAKTTLTYYKISYSNSFEKCWIYSVQINCSPSAQK